MLMGGGAGRCGGDGDLVPEAEHLILPGIWIYVSMHSVRWWTKRKIENKLQELIRAELYHSVSMVFALFGCRYLGDWMNVVVNMEMCLQTCKHPINYIFGSVTMPYILNNPKGHLKRPQCLHSL